MAGGIGKLTDKAIKACVAKAVPNTKLSDGGGLHLFITPAGNPTWRVKYRFGGKEKTYSPGPYPRISLAAARAEREQVKALVRQNKDPVSERHLRRAEGAAAVAQTFGAVAAEWLGRKKKEWSDQHHYKSARAFERDVLPYLGNLPIASISTAMVATAMEKIAARNALETAKRVLTQVSGVFSLAMAKGWCNTNPATDAGAVLPRKNTPGRMKALIAWHDLGEILRRARGSGLTRPVYMAHRLVAFTTMRIRNVVEAQWSEFDLDSDLPVWIIRRDLMKKKDERFPDHRVPLAPEIAAELRDWRNVAPKSRYVFPSPNNASRPITRESLEKAYRETLKLAGRHSPHGWRTSLTSQALDNGFNRDVVHMANDRNHDCEVALAYDRGERFYQRVELFNWWGQQLAKAEGIAIPRAAEPEGARQVPPAEDGMSTK
jgi:integrase